MSNTFYLKLAGSNIKKNGKTYIPYILTCVITVAMFYIIRSLSYNEGLDNMIGTQTLKSVLDFACVVTGIFAVIFLFYTNSFLMKRRKKEFGLYNILGMEKKHLSIIVSLETLYIFLISIISGLLIGILLDKLMFMLLLNMFEVEISLGFYISPLAIGLTLALFAGIFFCILLNSLRQICFTKPIDMLKGGKVGEKEPKAKWVIAIIGLLLVGAGYYISITTTNPLSAIFLFLVAAIMVIIGTYLLFTSGSIALLKLLRKNKNYYYKTNHFISVSGMMYRMKQNAVGLANICILSTAVLVMISSTFSLYIGQEDSINRVYPREIILRAFNATDENMDHVHEQTEDVLAKYNLKAEDAIQWRVLELTGKRTEDDFATKLDGEISYNQACALFYIPLEDYNQMEKTNKTLDDNEILVYSEHGTQLKNMNILGKEYRVKEELNSFIFYENYAMETYFVVVKDVAQVTDLYNAQQKIIAEMQETGGGFIYSDIRTCYAFDLDADRDTILNVYSDLIDNVAASSTEEEGFNGYFMCREEAKNDYISLYGGLFFVGMFLGLLFTMAMILIVYYKQISEGYEDKERFEIMQKVGMSHREVKKSIRSQVLTVFFLPLITAGIHVAFAYPLIIRLLALLNVTNVPVLIASSIVTFLIFAVIYIIIYSLTAKAYYRIVSNK